MNKIWKVAILIGLVVLVLGSASLAYAQTESPEPYAGRGYGRGMMGGGGRYGSGLAYGELGLYHDAMIESFAEALGLTDSQLQARLDNGETMWQIAEAEGKSWEEFSSTMQVARANALGQAVDNGAITQEQADFMNSRGLARSYGRGSNNCMGFEYGSQQGLSRGPQGGWNTP
jgi:hypothetical protein